MMRVSVLITNFNYGRYLPESIRCVLEQDFPADQFEVLVVDDGSTDDSRARAAAFGDRIRIHHQENRGQAAAFNTGFGFARGAYVALLDPDDLWRPGKLRAVVAALDADPALGLVQHWMETIDAQGRAQPTFIERWPARCTLKDWEEGRARFVGTSGLTFRRSALQDILPVPEELRYYADEYLYTHVLFEADAGNLSEVLGSYRVHGNNMYSGTLLRPRALEGRIRGRSAMDRHLEDRCRMHGLSVPKAQRLASERERLLCELFQHRLEGRWGDAGRARQALLDTFPGGWYRRFKGLTLLLAWASPALYARCFGFYQRNLWLGRIRGRLIPVRG